MSIASELSALNGHILGAYDEINTKGGTVPSNKNMANLASSIASIKIGGGGFDLSALYPFTELKSATLTATSEYKFDYSSADMTLSSPPRLFIIIPKETYNSSPYTNLSSLFFYSIGTNNGFTTLDDNVNMRANITYSSRSYTTWYRIGSYSSEHIFETSKIWTQTIFKFYDGVVRYYSPTTNPTGTTRVTLAVGEKYTCIFGC